MKQLSPGARQFLLLTTSLAVFLGGTSFQANAQRQLCPKIGGTCTSTGPASTTTTTTTTNEEEEPAAPTPTAGNKAFSFYELTSDSSLTATSDSSGSKTFKPKIKKSESAKKMGKLEFDEGEDNRRSCAWIPTVMPLKNKIIRIYYTLKFDSDKDKDQGEGTVLAFLPGSTSISSSLCGGYTEYLGYADRTGYTSMPEPRFGIEFDINKNTGMSDPDNNHLAIVYDKVNHNGTDSPDCPDTSSANDSTSPYGACWTGTNEKKSSWLMLPSQEFPWTPQLVAVPEPVMVADSDKDKEKDKDKDEDKESSTYPWLEDGSTHGYRVEITASSANCAATEVYVKAWACKSKDSSCSTTAFKTITSAYTGSATATIEKCVPFNPSTYQEMIVGFTFGSGSQDTKATYASFTMQTFDP
ncbi:MAG: hypothetical protein HQL43_11150 [Alphaproteobacteria bacterium]|nr:hypothetical protein [Alphaproteobacteria bacterium]